MGALDYQLINKSRAMFLFLENVCRWFATVEEHDDFGLSFPIDEELALWYWLYAFWDI